MQIVLEKLTNEANGAICEDFLQKAVSESVMCSGRTNSTASRKAAFSLLSSLHDAMKKIKNVDDDIAVRECMKLLASGLLGRPVMLASTITAITAYTYLIKGT